MIDNIKLKYLKNALEQQKIKDPTREDILRLLEGTIKYTQAGNYLKALKGVRR